MSIHARVLRFVSEATLADWEALPRIGKVIAPRAYSTAQALDKKALAALSNLSILKGIGDASEAEIEAAIIAGLDEWESVNGYGEPEA